MPLAWTWKSPNTCSKTLDKNLCICRCQRGRGGNTLTLSKWTDPGHSLCFIVVLFYAGIGVGTRTASSQKHYGADISYTMDESWALTVRSIFCWVLVSLQELDLEIKQDLPKIKVVNSSQPVCLKCLLNMTHAWKTPQKITSLNKIHFPPR